MSLTSIQYSNEHEILKVLIVGIDCNWTDNSFKKLSPLLERVDNG